jgi:hypothetical protein
MGCSTNCNLPKTVSRVEQLRGIESVSIIHPDTNTIASISPTDEYIPRGMKVSKIIKENSWFIRVELPNSWTEQDLLSFSVARTHGDSRKVETGPLPCIPWKIYPSPIVVDLSHWDEIADFPDF